MERHRQRRVLEQVSTHLKRKGHRVRTLPAETFLEAISALWPPVAPDIMADNLADLLP